MISAVIVINRQDTQGSSHLLWLLRGAIDTDYRSISHLKQLILHNSRRQRTEILPD